MRTEILPGHVAAVDLGSNSFHMVMGRVVEGRLQVLDRLREPVRLAIGLMENGELDEASQERAIQCLKRFGQRIGELPAHQIRAVGTNTLRKARNGYAFVRRASDALGHPIEVIPGREEARLIYVGVVRTSFPEPNRKLVIDIGGGSTELILGEALRSFETDSLFMGCVGYSQEFFPKGKISSRRFRSAKLAAALELQPIAQRYRTKGWQECIGSSGTIKAVGEILRASEWTNGNITKEALDKLVTQVLDTGHVDDLVLPTLETERRPVFAGGIAILAAVFESLGLASMQVASGALREGILYDLIGRIQHQDTREETIQHLCARYSVDLRQAQRVEKTALELLDQVALGWGLGGERPRLMLTWACRVHEIGLAVNYTGHHKHGAYLITNTDMPGFSRDEQYFLASLVRGHRRKIPKDLFDSLPREAVREASALCTVLRIAVLINRSRSEEDVPRARVQTRGRQLTISFDNSWLESHALTWTDLEREVKWMQELGIELEIAGAPQE